MYIAVPRPASFRSETSGSFTLVPIHTILQAIRYLTLHGRSLTRRSIHGSIKGGQTRPTACPLAPQALLLTLAPPTRLPRPLRPRTVGVMHRCTHTHTTHSRTPVPVIRKPVPSGTEPLLMRRWQSGARRGLGECDACHRARHRNSRRRQADAAP